MLSFETETPASPFLPCRDLPTMTILAIGVDARSDEYRYGRADVIRVVRINFKAQRVSMLQFPRDLWVKIPEVRDNLGTDRQKLNTAYTAIPVCTSGIIPARGLACWPVRST